MADEPARRSGRATKGQYTKDRDISEDLPAPKKKGKGKASKAKATDQEPEDGEDENIRCVCGQYDPDEEGRAMICCDECDAWQHNDCMGFPEDYEPEKYFCELHAPQDHKDLLAAMKRGEKPWEENRTRMAAEREAASKQKGGKRGRKSGARISEAPSRASQEHEDTPKRDTGRGGNNKRKLEDSPMTPEIKDVKKARATPTESDTKPTPQRKSSSLAKPARSVSVSGVELSRAPTDIKQLDNPARKGVASSLVKLFVAEMKDAVKNGAYTLSSGVTTEATGTQLALRVEYAMYMTKSAGSIEPNEAYKDQARSIIFNVKKNHQLRNSLLNGDLSEAQLASMTAADMASEEQQRADAEIIKKAEKQYTIVEDQGPRIRRTHKGEEFVNEADQIAAESTESRATKPTRRDSGVDQDGDASMNDPDGHVTHETDTKNPYVPENEPRPPQRQSSSTFDISNVWETVQGSPDTNTHHFPELPPQREPGEPVREPAGSGAGDDADIDRLLKDEDAESEPYSPKDIADGDGIIWTGVINGNALGRFDARAKYAAGTTPDALHLTWQTLIPSELSISGRIDPAKANEYLCGLQYSTTSDVIVVTVSQPEGSLQNALEFDRVFKYFKDRKRYGVITQQAESAIKDIYLIPLEQGDDLPEMLKLLEEKSIGDEKGRIVERMLMIPIVIKNTELSHLANANANMPPTPTMQTPMTPFDNQAAQGLPYPAQGVKYPYHPNHPHGVANAPPTTGPAPGQYYASPPPPYGTAATASGQQLPAHGPPQGRSALAVQILGPLVDTPAVAELLRQVPTVEEWQLEQLRSICLANPQAALELAILTGELRSRGDPSLGGPA